MPLLAYPESTSALLMQRENISQNAGNMNKIKNIWMSFQKLWKLVVI